VCEEMLRSEQIRQVTGLFGGKRARDGGAKKGSIEWEVKDRLRVLRGGWNRAVRGQRGERPPP